jgi:hypothetical protein
MEEEGISFHLGFPLATGMMRWLLAKAHKKRAVFGAIVLQVSQVV